MPKIDITKTELVWPGKYNEDDTLKEVPRVNLPFQVIETVNESRATREAKKNGVQGSLFYFYQGNEGETFEERWKNEHNGRRALPAYPQCRAVCVGAPERPRAHSLSSLP